MVRDYSLLFNKKSLADVIFHFNDGSLLYAHSSIFVCHSLYFQTTLIPMTGKHIDIPVDDFSSSIFEQAMKYCYGIDIDFSKENIVSIFEVSQRFQMQGLMKLCCTSVPKFNWELTELLQSCHLAVQSQCDLLLGSLAEILSDSCQALSDNEDILSSIEEIVLRKLVQSSEMKYRQCEVFKLVMKWGSLQEKRNVFSNVKKAVQKSLELIEFGEMSARELHDCVTSHKDMLSVATALRAFKEVLQVEGRYLNYGIPIDSDSRFVLENGKRAKLSKEGGLFSVEASEEAMNLKNNTILSSEMILTLNGTVNPNAYHR